MNEPKAERLEFDPTPFELNCPLTTDFNNRGEPLDPHFDQAFKIWCVLIEIDHYRPNLEAERLEGLSNKEFIDKWQPTYDRIMAMKAFL